MAWRGWRRPSGTLSSASWGGPSRNCTVCAMRRLGRSGRAPPTLSPQPSPLKGRGSQSQSERSGHPAPGWLSPSPLQGEWPKAGWGLATISRPLPHAHADLFAAVLEAHASDFASITEPRLTHEDLNPSNLLLVPGEDGNDDWRIAAILDFESAWAGCPESDIARLELWRDMMGEGFYEGYTAQQPISDGYQARRAVYQLLWCLEYARPTPEHHADTARVCAALGIPPVIFAPGG